MAISSSLASCLGLGAGLFSLLSALSFDLPKPLKFSAYLLSITGFGYGVAMTYQWEAEETYQSKLKAMDRELEDHELASRTNYLMEEVSYRYTFAPPTAEPAYAGQERGQLQQQAYLGLPAYDPLAVIQRSCGEAGVSFLEYVSGRGTKHAGTEGWFSVSKLRRCWGDHRGYSSESFTAFLDQLSQAGAGQFRDSSKRDWRPTITFN